MRPVVVLLVLVALFGLGCGGKSSDPSRGSGSSSAGVHASNSTSAPDTHGIPIPPKNARYTIHCRAITGVDHVFQARQLRDELIKTSGMRDWYIITGESETSLYYGYYPAIDNDTREGKQAQRDRGAIAAIRDVALNRPFAHAMLVEIVSANPVAPPEWNLANADGFWSLQIAAYKDHPDRKLAAVEAVKEARAQGIEAYYYHGPSVSSVCIGAWPREALKEQDANIENQYMSDNRPLLILPHTLPEGVSGEIRGPQGEKVTAVAPRLEYTDPTLVATMHKYPYHLLNGNEVRIRDPRTGKLHERPESSFLVQIPAGDPSLLGGGTRDTGTPQRTGTAPVIPAQPTRSTPGAGKLKSIGG